MTKHNDIAIKQGKSRFSAILSIVVIIAIVGVGLNFYDISDWYRAQKFTPSAEMAEIISELSLSSRAKNILYASSPVLQNIDEFSTSGCNDDTSGATLGCYSGSNIYVYDSENAELDGLEESTTAHELLHAIWDRLNYFEREALKPEIDSFYSSHEDELKSYMDKYSADQYYTELHSIIATQYAPSDYSETLRTHYSKYFTNLDSLQALYQKYIDVLNETKEELSQLKTEIDSMRETIAARNKSYSTEMKELNDDIKEFNQRAAHYDGTDVDFERDRVALLARQDSLSNYHDVTTKLIDEVNEKIQTYNQKAIHRNDLVKSINSKPKESTEIK